MEPKPFSTELARLFVKTYHDTGNLILSRGCDATSTDVVSKSRVQLILLLLRRATKAIVIAAIGTLCASVASILAGIATTWMIAAQRPRRQPTLEEPTLPAGSRSRNEPDHEPESIYAATDPAPMDVRV